MTCGTGGKTCGLRTCFGASRPGFRWGPSARIQDTGRAPGARTATMTQPKKWCRFNGIGVSSNEVVVESVGVDANPERMSSKSVGSPADLIELVII